ncbi:hypothetical protein [Listeria goaensis]|uniref:PD-(D/E)XK nuclease domain-containing protein n=1 Tax=Listeria goaensis TaxID=1649188 RepID=UPI000B58E485|nr:hypothetical protein [Listeria goaensis]
MAKQIYEERRGLKILISKAKALENVMEAIIFNTEGIGFNYASCNNFARNYNELANEAMQYIHFSANYHEYRINDLPNVNNMTGIEQKTLFEQVFYSTKMLLSTLEGSYEFLEDEADNLVNLISKRFRGLFHEVPTKEKDVQDALENFLIANSYDKGMDYDRETGKFNFSGREYIPDFIVPPLKLCIEVKLLKEKGKRSKLIEEINADVTAYSKQYERILFLVYDLGNIRDEVEFRRDIEAAGSVKLLLIKH